MAANERRVDFADYKPKPGERLLWWAVLNRALVDLERGASPLANDALAFLRGVGLWLGVCVVGITTAEYQSAVGEAVLARKDKGKCLKLGG